MGEKIILCFSHAVVCVQRVFEFMKSMEMEIKTMLDRHDFLISSARTDDSNEEGSSSDESLIQKKIILTSSFQT